ncbi:MAG: anthranilate phosphoribosyltransferase [Hydrogenophilaceae bacterium]|jgi:anthranilate phosphoribosyltransferase|nr:anthranilate phosphoribosyltransferase [Hydrogenophilaceae bacterium]
MSDLAADFARILDGETSFEETKAFLVRSIDLMGDAAALAAGAQALRERMIAVSAPAGAIDVCGTGGDGAHTLNISTAVAFVVAGAGVPVAKHGNRAMSSKSGAADVLEALGVKLTGHVPTLERCLREAGVAFLFAQNHHPAMRHVAAARRELGVRTIFNLLGPLANPARVKRQLVGVFSADYLAPIAAALRAIGGERAIVVHGAGGLDELSFIAGGANQAVLLTQDGAVARLATPAPKPTVEAHALRGGSAAENAAALARLLDGEGVLGAYEDAVLLNAAFALLAADRVADWREGWALAEQSLRSGAAKSVLQALIANTAAAP